jgi:hypothetical protein
MESDGTTTDRAAAAAELAALRSDRAQLAERAMQPWWYDVALGLLVFGLAAQYSLDNDAVSIIASFVFIAACLGLAQVYRRITGFAVGGFRRGRTRGVLGIWFVLAAGVMVGASWLEHVHGVHEAMVIAGAVLGISIALASRWWSRVYIAELREGL